MKQRLFIWILTFLIIPNILAQTQKEPTSDKSTQVLDAGGIIDEMLLPEDGEGGLSQDVSTTVIFSNDVFLKKSGFQFSPFRFRIRGYDSRHEEKYINGVNFNESVRGIFNYSSIGAMNDITKNGDAINYFAPSNFTFGDIGGAQNINMRAGSYTRGGKITLSATNRNYYSRAMASYTTGMMDNGWALMALVGGRYSHEGNIQGTFYKNMSYALGVEKMWADGTHRLSFTTFGSPVQRGQQGSSYQEVYDLTGNNFYNPNWGYQNGEKRNSRVVTSYDPTAIISHIWKINETSDLRTGLGVHYNRYGRTSLNWYNGADPRPDYYRYLPSYAGADSISWQYYAYQWSPNGSKNVSQINWDRLWDINHMNVMNGDSSAIYMIQEERKGLFETVFNTAFNTSFTDRVKFHAGLEAKKATSKQFKTVEDLLGATYVMDIDKFAERDFPGDRITIQNDLEKPYRRAFKDDVFGYDFRYYIHSASLWAQLEHNYRHLDIYYGAKMNYDLYQRDGKMRNGRYPDNSFGKDTEHSFLGYETKLGLTYKISGRHFIQANTSVQAKAPLIDNIYINSRISDKTIENPGLLNIYHIDLGYIFSMPSINGRISLFNTWFKNDITRYGFYHDTERTFVSHVLSGVDRVYRGIEAGINYKLNDNWNFDLVGTVSEYYNSNNPLGVMNSENGKVKDVTETVYMKNTYIGGIPQALGTLGINYFYDYWFISLNVNAFGNTYIDVAPSRRISSIYNTVIPPEAIGYDENIYKTYQSLTTQEKFKGGATLDFSLGKLWYLPNRDAINLNLSVMNILNNRDIRTGGYEQGRVDLSNSNKFASKYFYMQGINFFLNTSYRF